MQRNETVFILFKLNSFIIPDFSVFGRNCTTINHYITNEKDLFFAYSFLLQIDNTALLCYKKIIRNKSVSILLIFSGIVLSNDLRPASYALLLFQVLQQRECKLWWSLRLLQLSRGRVFPQELFSQFRS